MKKREVKKLLRDNPEFSNWVKKDPVRMENIRSNPDETVRMMAKWRSEARKKLNPFLVDFEMLSDKSKRASEMLGSIQSVLEMLSEYSKKEYEKE